MKTKPQKPTKANRRSAQVPSSSEPTGTVLKFPAKDPAPPAAPKTHSAASESSRSTRRKPAAVEKPAARPIKLFQIFYDEWHAQLLDPEFEPYDNRGKHTELLEFAVFEDLATSARVKGAQYWGALSWRFTEKTGVNGKQLLQIIAAHPGFDVYYCNPYPANEGIYHNMWVQGEPSHPSFLQLARAFFDAAGLPANSLSAIETSSAFSAANFFIASPAFWESYIQFVRHALGNAQRKMSRPMRSLLHSKIADPTGYHFGATYVPFIVERLFGMFLSTEGARFKRYKIALPEREKELNVHVRLLREMKDVAHKSNSKWLAACWVNYRSLYLNQVHGREWCQQHLRNITPTDVRFG